MKVKNSFNVNFTLKVVFGESESGELSFVFSVSIEGVQWEEKVQYYPFLDELSKALEESPLPSYLNAPPFPSELLDNYSFIVEVFENNKKDENRELLKTIEDRLEEFMVGLLSNLHSIPAEAMLICKQILFRSVHKVQVFECLMGNFSPTPSPRSSAKPPLPQKSPANRELSQLKKMLKLSTEGKLLLDALAGVEGEEAMKHALSSNSGVPHASMQDKNAASSAANTTRGSVAETTRSTRVSTSSPMSPLLLALAQAPSPTNASLSAPLGPTSPTNASPAPPVAEDPLYPTVAVLASKGLEIADLALTLRKLRGDGVPVTALLPDKHMRGKPARGLLKVSGGGGTGGGIAAAAGVLGGDMVLDLVISPPDPAKAAERHLVFSVRDDLGGAHAGKGPTLVSTPPSIPPAALLHLSLLHKPEMNLSALPLDDSAQGLAAGDGERARDLLVCTLNWATAGLRRAEGGVQGGVAVTKHLLRQSLATPSRLSVSGAGTPTPSNSQRQSVPRFFPPEGNTGADANRSRASSFDASDPADFAQDDEPPSDLLFSLPLVPTLFSACHLLARPRLSTSSRVGRVGESYRASVGDVLARPPSLLLFSQVGELVFFALPAPWLVPGGEPGVVALQGRGTKFMSLLANLSHVPFPPRLLDKYNVYCERVVYVPGIISAERGADERLLLIQTEDEVINLHVPSVEVCASLVELIVTQKKASIRLQSRQEASADTPRRSEVAK